MKTAIISYIVLAVVILLVVLNSLFIVYNIDVIVSRLKKAPDSLDAGAIYEDIFSDYMKRQKYIGLSVSHDDLTSIESEFNEILGAIKANDDKSLIIAKSRLIGALTHLRRLSSINADSILFGYAKSDISFL